MAQEKKNFGIIVGSLRKDSYNRKIANFIMKTYAELANFELIEIKNFPLFNEDLEANVPDVVLKARAAIKSKDGIIIVTPEYNHSIPGGIKNALDWFSRDDYCMMKKPYFIMGASMGTMGTARSQDHIRQVLNSGAFQMYSLPNNEFLFATVQDKLDEEGNLIDAYALNKLSKRINEFIKFTDVVQTSLENK